MIRPVLKVSIALVIAVGATPRVVLGQEDPRAEPAKELTVEQIEIAPGGPRPQNGRLLLPEGAFLAGQEGTLVLTPEGDRLFVYLPDGEQAATAMIMVPCGELRRIEQAAAESGEEHPVFKVNGQVLAYHKRNYLLPTAWTQLRSGQPTAETGSTPPLEQEDDEIAALLTELEESREDPQAALRRGDRLWFAPRRPQDDEESPTSLPDGSMISRRTGRLVRQGVVWTITFDNSVAAEGLDAPLVVLPCLNHERLERLAGQRGDEFTVEVSGRVFVYRGRLFLLTSVFQVTPKTDVRPIG